MELHRLLFKDPDSKETLPDKEEAFVKRRDWICLHYETVRYPDSLVSVPDVGQYFAYSPERTAFVICS